MRRPFALFVTLTFAAGVTLACVTRPLPGSEVIGNFAFTASVAPAVSNCSYAEMPTLDFTFNGTFSRNPNGKTYFTIGDTNRSATFDGQIITSSGSAPRHFDSCCADGTTVNETLTVALLSRSQANALADPSTCPANPLSGGVPTPDADAGITGPGSTGTSFDAVLACGTLEDDVAVADGCLPADGGTCESCSVSYPVQGVRR